MKKLLLVLIIVTVGLSGCGDKEAREYAKKMIPLLDSYQEQLTNKIKAEQDFYLESGDIYQQAREDEVITRLKTERALRAIDISDRFSDGKSSPSLSQIITSLQSYGKLDFETTQTLLQEELETRSKYLNDLESIEIELQKIKVFRKALEELTESKSDLKKLKETAEALDKTNQEVNKLFCADFKKQLEELNDAKKEFEDKLEDAGDDEKPELNRKIKKTQRQITKIQEQMENKKCS